MYWVDALSYCANLDLGGFQDWRLPDIIELQSIVDYSRYGSAIDTTYFTDGSALFWSSTNYSEYTWYARYVYFYNGYSSAQFKTNSHYARCVR
jgi:hypothetical protein